MAESASSHLADARANAKSGAGSGAARGSPLLLSAVLCGFGLLAALGVWRKTVTTDEPFHLMYSRQGLLDGTFVRWIPGSEVAHNSKMPVSLPNAAVSVLLDRLSDPPDPHIRLFLERLPTIAWGILGAAYTFLLARRLFGVRAAWICLGLFVTEPNILAHSGLITTDVPATAAVIACFYHFYDYLLRPHRKQALILGAVLGLAQVSKYSCVMLVPVLGAVFLVHRWLHRRRGGTPSGPRQRWSSVAGHLLLATAAMLLVINAAFGFEGTGQPYPRDPPDPAKFEKFGKAGTILRAGFAVVRPMLGAFPTPYLQGLSMVIQNDRQGPGPHVYVRGKLSDRGVPWYFLVVAGFKWTLPVLLLLGASLVTLAWRRFRGASAVVLIVLVPAAVQFLHSSIGLNHQLGLRYVLPVIPLAILGGAGVLAATVTTRAGRVILYVLLGWQALSMAAWFPHWLSYSNELLVDKNKAYTLFADSNVQWGQDDGALQDYVREHPEENLVVDPAVAASGRLAVGVNELVGQSNRIDYFMSHRYAWLREHFEPAGRITHSFLVFEVSEADLLALHARSAARDVAEGLPRPMTQWFPPWIEKGEPEPSLEVRPGALRDASVQTVRAEIRSLVIKTRPWNLWVEELDAAGRRHLASGIHRIEVAADRPCVLEIPVTAQGTTGAPLRAWLGIFPDRFVASTPVALR